MILIEDVAHLIDVHDLFENVNEWFDDPALIYVLFAEMYLVHVFFFSFVKVHDIYFNTPIIQRLVFEVERILYFMLDHELFQAAAHYKG